jgi:RHS repeat-associated protein
MTPTTKNQLQDTNFDYVYDAAGNLIQPGPIGGPYVFDAENHLTSAGGMAYLYDGDGKRVGKAPVSSPTQPNYLYWYGTGSQNIEETDGSGNYAYEDYYFNGMLLARGEPDNWVDHFFADALGNTRCVYGDGDPDGGCSDYYPFGGERPIPSCCPTNPGGVNVPFMFTGKERDSESGLDNFGARYLGSSLGRFMSPDSTGYVKPVNPQSWNLYAYARNNPLLYVDPTGNTVSLANCQDKNTCAQVLINAAQLPKGVTAEVDKKGNLVLKGDLSQIKGGNALRLLQLVQSDKTANFWIGDKAPQLGGGTQDIRGGLSGLTSQGFNQNFAVVQSDPSKNDSGLGGAFLNPDGTTTEGQIPGADIGEAAAHELLGHVWADLVGGEAADTQGNVKEALIAEDRVRNTDPARGIKIRHHDDRDSVQLIKVTDLPRITNPGSQP